MKRSRNTYLAPFKTDVDKNSYHPVIFISNHEDRELSYHLYRPDDAFPIGIEVAKKFITLQGDELKQDDAITLFAALSDLFWDEDLEVRRCTSIPGFVMTDENRKIIKERIAEDKAVALDVIGDITKITLSKAEELGAWDFNIDRRDLEGIGACQVMEVNEE